MLGPSKAVAVALPGFGLDAQTGVHVPRKTAKGTRDRVPYQDGSEDYIAKVVASASDISCGSDELAESIRDFPSRYHLSPDRLNLLRPLTYLLRGRILEVGAGCGAITRFLGETGAEVIAIESSAERARICRSRCRDLANVSVIAGELSDLNGSAEFDVVVAVGVLEYSQMFMGGSQGPRAFLRTCKNLLKPGGHLVLAIENQLGMKYLAGAPEDHLDQPYAGIEERYGDSSPITFGYRELRRLISSAGWTRQQFLYPFPDYKFPNVVLGGEALDDDSELISSIVRFTPGYDPVSPYYASFSEEMVWPVAIRNGVAQALANSFLVVAGDGRSELARCPIHFFSTRRRRAFAKVTVMDPAHSETVRRRLVYPEAYDDAGEFHQHIEDEPLLQGKLLMEDFCEIVNRPGWTSRDLALCAGPWVSYLRFFRLREGDLGDDEDDPVLPGDMLDCVPANLVRDASGLLHPFDQEWISRAPIALSHVLARGLFDFLLRLRSVATPGDSASDSIYDLVVECISLLGIPSAAAKVNLAVEAELRFQEHATGAQPRSAALYRNSRLRLIRRAELLRNLGASLQSSDTGSKEALMAALIESRDRERRLNSELEWLKSSRTARIARRLSRLWPKISGR